MKYGYLAEAPKPSDHLFSLELAPKLVATTDGDVDFRSFCTETNQYNLDGCAGNATADSVEILNSLEGLPPVQLSRLFVYTLARNFMDLDHDGRPDINKDDGTYISLCFDVLSKFGICREDLPAGKGGWPYDPSKVAVLPDLMAMRAATAHRIHSYYRIDAAGDDRLQQILTALRAKHPVVFGTSVDDAFRTVSGDTPWVRTGVSIGGHAMVIVGYIAALGCFIVKNSWGKGWGINGFCFMKPDVFTSSDTQDIWVPTLGSVFH